MPVDEEIPAVSDNVVKAITGESWMVSNRIPLGLNQTCIFKSWVLFRELCSVLPFLLVFEPLLNQEKLIKTAIQYYAILKHT
jgi:hypothetical protein